MPDALDTIPALIGKKIYLRPLDSEDVRFMYSWFLASDPQTQTCHQATLLTPDDAAERQKSRERNNERGDFVIVRMDDHERVGRINYFHLNMLNRSAEFGYLIGPEYRESGFGAEAVKLLSSYLFKYLNLNKVYAQTASFNKASIRLLESLDFRLDGTLRQHHYFNGDLYDDLVYSLLRFECNF